MDLSHPLSSIAPSLEAEALTVLVRTETPLTGRRVAELARRGSHAQISAVLQRLVHQGLVDVQPAGRANLYHFNREHLLAPAVQSASFATTELRARLASYVSTWAVPCVHASLFGSLARGEAGQDSDVDILVVRPARLGPSDAESWADQLSGLEDKVPRWTGNSLSWFETTEADLKRAAAAGEPIFESWREDAIDLAGEPLRATLRRLQIHTVDSTGQD